MSLLQKQRPIVRVGSAASRRGPVGQPVSDILGPVVAALAGTPPCVRFEFWDGSSIGAVEAPGSLVLRSPDALRRIMWAPNEIGFARAYIAGDIEIEGDVPGVLRALLRADGQQLAFGPRSLPALISAARRVGAVGRNLPPPPEELIPRGGLHSRARDALSVRHHYDVGNEFYRLFLGPSLTYSCARFESADATLEDAQAAKHDLICRKLGLQDSPGLRLLDVGCGWGSMALHAAIRYDATVVGVTLSEEQAAGARQRVHEAGMDSQVEIRVQDYRDIGDEVFDAVSSVGMFEHVGHDQADTYFSNLRKLLRDGGRLLNHAISSVQVNRLERNSFMYRYVFPDGELCNVGDTAIAMQRAGFEVRDVESLREHYARTLRLWLANLDAAFGEATNLAGHNRARIWRLYLSGSIIGFDDGGISIHQILGVVPDGQGQSFMPPTRVGWEAAR